MNTPLFTLVTSNQEKIHFATLSLNKYHLPFDVHSISVPELQSENPLELITHKAQGAYDILHKPIVVIDHFWSFPAVGGFPGPYMRFVNDHMKAQDILRLMQGLEDRRAILTECICYKNSTITQTFFEEVVGTILTEPRGEGNAGQQVISFSKDGKSIAEHLNAGTDPREKSKRKVWKELAIWFREESKKEMI